jgi:hypothetical protein
MVHLLLCSQQYTTGPCPEPNNTPITVITTVHYLTISWAKWYTYYFVYNSPLFDHVLSQMEHLLLCSQQSTTWPCPKPNGTPITVFTTVNYLTMSWAKWYTSYRVHNSPLLDHVLSQMIYVLLCSQQSTTLPCPQPNDTPITVFTTVHYLTMSWAKLYTYYWVHNSPLLDHVLSQMIHILLCSQPTIWPCPEQNNTYITVFTTVNYLTMSSAKWYNYYCVHKQSTIWPCPEPNDTPITMFTTVHNLTMSWAKWYTYYCVHNRPLLDHVLSQIIQILLCSQQSNIWPCPEPNNTPITLFTTVHYLTMSSAKWYNYNCVQNSPLFDHVLSQMLHILLCSQQSTIWPCPEPNDTYITVFTTVHYLTMSWAK